MRDPTIDAARDILADSLRELRSAFRGCTADELNRRPPGDDTNSIAVLVTHAMHSTRSWLSLATGAPPPERDRPAEFLVTVDDPSAFVVVVRRDGCRVPERSSTVTSPSNPASTHVAPWQTHGGAEPVTAAWALLHALEHLREHVGHAQLTAQTV